LSLSVREVAALVDRELEPVVGAAKLDGVADKFAGGAPAGLRLGA
jgi:hypothetical protein